MPSCEHFFTPLHQLRHAASSISDLLLQLESDKRRGLGEIELQASGETTLGKGASLIDNKFIEFAYGQAHRTTGVFAVTGVCLRWRGPKVTFSYYTRVTETLRQMLKRTVYSVL